MFNIFHRQQTIQKTEMPTIEDWHTKQKLPPLMSIGVKPITPTLFFDIDVKYLNQPELDVVNKEMKWKWTIPFNEELLEIHSLNNPLEQIERYIKMKERHFFCSNLSHYHNAIYKTKDGYHLVMSMPTFDRTQFALYELKTIFPRSNYIMNCRKLRLRISPKWNWKTGNIVSPEPYLFENCKCYQDIRVGIKEKYYTYD